MVQAYCRVTDFVRFYLTNTQDRTNGCTKPVAFGFKHDVLNVECCFVHVMSMHGAAP